MKRAKTYDDRLQTVASLVRDGAVLADVGSDHAYLPIALLEGRRIRSAVASDINDGPIANARANIAKAKLSHKIDTVCCNGLAPLASFAPTDVVIAGMGGMLIVEILQAASFIRDPKIRLILQPMRDAAAVRSYLAGAGFAMVAERLCTADGKLYQVIAAEYTGKPYVLTEMEALLGPCLLAERSDPLLATLVEKEKKALAVRIAGLARAGKQEQSLNLLLAGMEALQL